MNVNVYPFLLQSEEDFELAKDHVDAGGGFVSHAYAYEHDNVPDEYPCLAKFRCWDDPNGPYHCTWSFETEEDLQEKLERFKEIEG